MKRSFRIFLALIFVAALSAACKSEQPSASGSTTASKTTVASKSASAYAKNYRIACIYPTIQDGYWGAVYNGCRKALQELSLCGVNGYCTAPANADDYALETALIDAALSQGVDGIVLSAVNADFVGAYITDNFTKNNGCPIVVVDRSLYTTSPWVVTQVMTDSYTMSHDAAKLAQESTGNIGYYVLFGNAPSILSWGNLGAIGAHEFFEDHTDMENAYPSGDGIWWGSQSTAELNFQFAQDSCLNYPNDPIAFLVVKEANISTVLDAIEALPARPENAPIYIVSSEFSQNIYDSIKNGRVYGATGVNYYLMGYNSTYALINCLETGETEEFIPVPYCVITQDTLQTTEVQEFLRSNCIWD